VRVLATLTLLLVASTNGADAQTLGVHAAGGPTLVDAGYSFAAGLNYAPTSRLALLFQYDHTHINSRTTGDGRGTVTNFRGGTLSLGSAELRVTPFRHDRIGPYGLAGVAVGISTPNVNAVFPTRVTNKAGGLALGGGMHVPFGDRIAAFADVRIIVGAEGDDGVLGVAPVRAGLLWRF
jgi:opacity protein-like surface antigen